MGNHQYAHELCKSWCKEKISVEFQWWYDGISMRQCKECWTCYDRRSWLKIVTIYNDGDCEYWQPMFLLEDGSMSRMDERWHNKLHKKMKLNWIKFYNTKKVDNK